MLTADSRSLFLLEPGLVYLNHGGFGATPKDVLDEKRRILVEIERNPVEIFQHSIRARWHAVAEKIAARFSLEAESVAIIDNATDGITAFLRSLSLNEALHRSLCSGCLT